MFWLINKKIKFKGNREDSNQMGLVTTKTVLGVSDKVRFKPAC